MKRHFFCIYFVFCICVINLFGGFTSLAQAEDRNTTQSEVDINKENLSLIIESVLENQEKILVDMEAEQNKFQALLPEQVGEITTLRQNVYNDFNRIYKIYWLNKEHPKELSQVAEQVSRFSFQLTALYDPLVQEHAQVDFRLQQLNNLIESLSTVNTQTSKSMLRRAQKLLAFYTKSNSQLEKTIALTKKVLDKINATRQELENNMPRFWLKYYTQQEVDFSTTSFTVKDDDFFKRIISLSKVFFLREIPLSSHAWLIIAQSFISLTIPFGILLFLAYKFLPLLLPRTMVSVGRNILATTIPWIIMGIVLQFTSWHGGNRYQIINALGTALQCYGQIRLAWQMLNLHRDEPLAPYTPFFLIIPLLVGAFFLLNLTDISLVFTFIWALLLVCLIMLIYKSKPSPLLTSRILLRSLMASMGLGLLCIFITGHVHLSYFIVLCATCIIMGIHQAEACLHATSLITPLLPQSGFRALAYGLLLAVSLPIILTLAVLAPLSWLLTFPGGEYLINSLGNFNINVGKLSFNALQILSVATVFYLIKSIISVSSHYIDNTWSKNSNDALASLATPIKTTIFFGFWGIFVLYVLKSVGFDLSNIAVIAGGLSVGIGLGMQGIVQNTFSGFALIFGRNLREGDVVEVGTINGIVQKVSLRATRVRTLDNSTVFIPNSEFMNKSFINWTHNGNRRRCSIMLGVAYDSDLDLVKSTVLEVIKSDERVARHPEPALFFMDFAASSLDFEVRFWIHNVLDRLSISSSLRFAIMEAFKEKGIEIPFPQTDVHIKRD